MESSIPTYRLRFRIDYCLEKEKTHEEIVFACVSTRCNSQTLEVVSDIATMVPERGCGTLYSAGEQMQLAAPIPIAIQQLQR